MKEIGDVLDAMLPPHGEYPGPFYKWPQPSAAEYRLRDLTREGLQVLEHARLVMPKGYSTNGNWYKSGWVTTRLARTALANRSVDQILSTVSQPDVIDDVNDVRWPRVRSHAWQGSSPSRCTHRSPRHYMSLTAMSGVGGVTPEET